jgi:DNA-binding HxlR family transcriptional regulator
MLPRTYSEQNCPIAAGLEVVGERWTLLILRDAFLGIRRFDDFQTRLEMSRTVLSKRLDALVDAGLLRRAAYQERPARHDYVPTDRALDLWPTIAGIAQWGNGHAAPDGPPREFVHDACGSVVHAEVRCPHCDVAVTPEHAASRPGAGAKPTGGEFAAALSEPRPLLRPFR